MAAGSHLLSDPAQVATALHPLRRRLLELLDRPESASGLARRLDLPRQRVNYHVRALADLGLIRLAGERPRRGFTERLFVRTASSVVVDPDIVDRGVLDRRSATALGAATAAAVDVIRHATKVSSEAADHGQQVAAATLISAVRLPNPASLRRFTDDLADLFARHDRSAGDGGMTFTVTTTVLPSPGGS